MSDYILPDPFPPIWASDWGEDDCGLWMAFTYKGVRQAFRWIPPGRFLMGSPESEAGRSDDEIQHEVILTQGYWLAETVCTQALWEVVMGENPSQFNGSERPVENINWDDARSFMQRLNDEQDELGLRFPTEAEWEHACRAGTQTAFSFGKVINQKQVNYYAGSGKSRSEGKTVGVKALPKNNWGLYQMHGNVWEWCADWYDKYPTQSVTDPVGPIAGGNRVLRGGSWFSSARYARSAYRNSYDPFDRDFIDYSGFRLARGPKGDRPAGE